MPIKLGVVMDPIGSINVAKDSTLAMLREAAKRRYELVYLEPGDLYLAGETAMADRIHRIHFTGAGICRIYGDRI